MTTRVLSASIDGNRDAAEPPESGRSSGLQAWEQWKAFRKICVAIAILFFIKFAAFGLFLTPLWDIPDESGHYSYVEDLSHGRMPLLGETRISRDVTDSWKGPNARHRHRNWIAQHPPLYYALSAPVAFTIRAMGEGFTWDTQDRQRDLAAARAAWEQAKAMIADPQYKMVLLDELNIVLRYDYLPLDEVLEVLRNKPRDLHVIVTGRNAKDELIEIADLVTEMTEIKHPFRSGVKAQAGVEF